jgi:hypothetical protein
MLAHSTRELPLVAIEAGLALMKAPVGVGVGEGVCVVVEPFGVFVGVGVGVGVVQACPRTAAFTSSRPTPKWSSSPGGPRSQAAFKIALLSPAVVRLGFAALARMKAPETIGAENDVPLT